MILRLGTFFSWWRVLTPFFFQVVNLNTQLRYFKKVEKQLRKELGDEESKKLLLEAVYLISIGGNDYISPLFRNQSVYQIYSHRQYLDMVMGNLTVVIEVIRPRCFLTLKYDCCYFFSMLGLIVFHLNHLLENISERRKEIRVCEHGAIRMSTGHESNQTPTRKRWRVLGRSHSAS